MSRRAGGAVGARCLISGRGLHRFNGPSCSGKSSIAAALQDRWPRPLQSTGVDTFLASQSERFFAIDDVAPQSYRALRHLEAGNTRFDSTAWMDVWTEADASGFRYQIAAEDGSDYLRTRVFRETLKSERALWASGAPDRAGFTSTNYIFEDHGSRVEGLAWLTVKPRRKDVLLVDGSIFLDPRDGDLVRLEGRLSK